MKRIVVLFLVVCTLIGSKTNFLAEENNVTESKYQQEHFQVNFEQVDFCVLDGKIVSLQPTSNLWFFERKEVEKEIGMMVDAIHLVPEIESTIVEGLKSASELVAMSVTVAPIAYVDDHYERVASTSTYGFAAVDGTYTGKENFVMYTSVQKDEYPNANGTYDYTTTTYGWWAKNSFWGGSAYPASGDDYIFQAAPEDWIRKTCDIDIVYDTEETGAQGTGYTFHSGDASYIKCAIVDDPFGWGQLKEFEMTTVWAANATVDYRMINCYYIHTWTSLSIDVSVSVASPKQVQLNFDPSIENKSWEVYNWVTFDF